MIGKRKKSFIIAGILLCLFVLGGLFLAINLKAPFLLIIDKKYPDMYGRQRLRLQLKLDTLRCLRRIEYLELEDTVDSEMFMSLIEARKKKPARLIVVHWLAPLAEVLHNRDADIDLLILGGREKHEAFPTVYFDELQTFSQALHFILKKNRKEVGKLAIVVDAKKYDDYARVAEALLEETWGNIGYNFYSATPTKNAPVPHWVYRDFFGIFNLPESWKQAKIITTSALAGKYMPASYVAVLDNSIFRGLRAAVLLKPGVTEAVYTGKMMKLRGKNR